MNQQEPGQVESRDLAPARIIEERRRTRRARVEFAARVRPYNESPIIVEEIRATLNFSRDGLYFTTKHRAYSIGMHVYVTCPYSESQAGSEGDLARIVRVEPQEDGRWGVAVNFLRSFGYHNCGGFQSAK